MDVLFSVFRWGHDHVDDHLRPRCRSSACIWWQPSGRASRTSNSTELCRPTSSSEYIAQKEWIFPPEPHLRLIGDLMEYTDANMPRYKPLSVSGYHIREAGATAAQELAFTLADGFWLRGARTSPRSGCRPFRTWPEFLLRRAHRLLLRKSRSSAPHAVSGRGGCATATERPARAQWLRFTPRPPGSR